MNIQPHTHEPLGSDPRRTLQKFSPPFILQGPGVFIEDISKVGFFFFFFFFIMNISLEMSGAKVHEPERSRSYDPDE